MAKNIDLEVNGRLFPSWILKNFKDFMLQPVTRIEGEDPCKEKEKKELTVYQRFLGQYLSYKSPFQDVLVYHGLGSGKTVSAINIYNVLFNYTPKWNVFILLKASLEKDPWIKDLKVWIESKDSELRWKNIKFIHYDAPNADQSFLDAMKKADAANKPLFIIEEAHNFIRNVYNNISSKKGKRAQVIYDYIKQEKKENSATRIIMLSATPAVNNPYELALMFNLMRPGTFPESEAIFSQIYVSSTNFSSINDETKNMFQRRILGLVSYYIGATPDKFAEKIVHYENIVMPKAFQDTYNYFEEIEEEKEKIRMKMRRNTSSADEMSTYKSYTRQASNFIFPNINQKVYGEKRPRPGQFRLSDKDAAIIDEGKNKEKLSAVLKNEVAKLYADATQEFVNSLIEFFKKLYREDKEKGLTLQNDLKTYFEKYNGKFNKFFDEEKKKSSLFTSMYNSSPKMIRIIFRLLKSKGPVLVYSNYVEMEGLQIFKVYLNCFGFSDVLDTKAEGKEFRKYMEYHGGIDKDIRENNKAVFNSKENRYGKLTKIILLSPAGAEGINLRNVRQVHITEPYWNEVRIEQIIGRAIRQCSHADLPLDERKVDVYRYKMVRDNGKETTDENLEEISRRKNNLIQSFLEAVRESAVDCGLFRAHNMMGMEYKCFSFNEESQFEKPVGPAFREDLDYDQKINNGSNSLDAIRLRIKVKPIKVVNKLEEGGYSETMKVLYNEDTRIVYDGDLHYPIGKIELDDLGEPVKIEGDIFVIGELIDIPKFTYYE